MLGPDSLSLVVKRADFVEALADRPLEKRELTTELEYSRATVNRAVGALEDAGLVRETRAGYEPTLAARLAVEAYREFVSTGTDVVDATDVLGALDHDADVAPALLRDADRFPVEESGTYANFERVGAFVEDAASVAVVVPSERALPALDHWQDALVAADDATVVLDAAVHETVRGDHRSLSWLAAQGVDVLAGETPSFLLVRAEAPDEARTALLAYDDDAGGFGALVNDSPAALDWAAAVVDAGRAAADRVAASFETASTPGGDPRARSGRRRTLPPVLEAEGFASLSASYFETHPSRDLATALRTGLTIADVRDGLAIERAGGEDATADSLTDAVLADLDAGEDCAVVGRAGAGKSTVCKSVACEWADSDRGRVLYRESGQRQPFESVASLRSFLREATGDVLVVVEDAVRPEANAVLEVAAAFSAADDVQFLLDARDSDWNETRLLPVDAAVREYKNSGFAVTSVAAPTAAECRRLLDRYEAETGTTLDVTGDQLLDRIDDATSVSGGMFLLAHHIRLHADPVSTADDVTPTPLVEDVQRRIRRLQRDAPAVAMDAALLTGFLNVADRPVHEEFIEAQALDAPDATADGIRSALTACQLVVDDGADGLRTPHNQWSRVFLVEALDVLVDAPQRLGRALDRVFDLTAAETRSAIGTRTRNSAPLRRIAADPTAWADDLARQLFEAGEDHLGLTPYYGTFENPTFDLRTPCSVETVFECASLRAHHLTERGDLDGAAAEYRTVLDAIADSDAADRLDGTRADCLLVLGSVRGRRGELDAYEDHAERALELHRESGDDHGVARCYLGLGQAAFRRGDYERSAEYAEAAASTFDDLGDLARKARALGNVSTSAFSVGDYDEAAAHAREVLEIRDALGTTHGVAAAHMMLGRVAERRGEYERAMACHRRSLSAARSAGSEHWCVVALNNMGNVATYLGRLDDARSYFGRAADRNESVGEPKYDAIRMETLAEVERRRGDLEAARSHVETALERARTAGVPHVRATARTRRGQLALADGDHATARTELADALETFREHGEAAWQLLARIHLARVELDAGERAAASRHVDAAADRLDVWRDRANEARVETLRGRVRLARGDREGARECFEAVASMVDEVTDPYVRAVVHARLGEFAAVTGDAERAAEHARTAESLAADAGAVVPVPDAAATAVEPGSAPHAED